MEKWGAQEMPGPWQRQSAQKEVEIKARLQISSGISAAWPRAASGCFLSLGGPGRSSSRVLSSGLANCLLTLWAGVGRGWRRQGTGRARKRASLLGEYCLEKGEL